MANSTDRLYVTYVDAFGDLLKIWGQRDRTCATYIDKQLMKLMTEFNMMPSPSASSIQKGMICFAKCSHGKYCRVRIISDVINNNVTAHFIDYGFKEKVDLSNIRLQNGSNVITTIVSQADEFFLANVGAHGCWFQEVLNEIKRDLCYKEYVYTIKYQYKNEKFIQINFHEEDYASALLRRNLTKFLSITDQVFFLKYAFKNQEQHGNHSIPFINSMNIPQSKPEIVPHQIPPSSNIPSLVQTKTDLQKRLVQTVTFNNKTNNNHLPLTESKTPTVINSGVIEALADQLKQHLFKEVINNHNTPETVSHNYVTEVLQVGTTHSVYVSYIDDGPWSFSIQLVSCEHELNRLMDELAACDLNPVKLPVVLGYPCIAKSKEYDNICRGVVVNISHSAVKIYFVDFGNTEDLPVSSIFELPAKFFKFKAMSQRFALSGLQKIKPSHEIKKAFNEVVENELLLLHVTTLEGENLPTCDLYLKNTNIKRILNEKVLEIRKWTPIQPPKDGEVENVVVTWIDSPQKFYVQLKRNDIELENLKSELAQWGATGEFYSPDELSIGALCICRFSGDNEWYRAIVTSIRSKDSATVFYVDYGNTEEVRPSAIKRIGNGLIRQLSTQAVQCCLHGFENRQTNPEIKPVLEALILEKELRLKVVYTDNDHIVVKLFDNDNDISLSLLENRVPLKPYSNTAAKDLKEETDKNMCEKTDGEFRKNDIKNRNLSTQNNVEEKSLRKKEESSPKSDGSSESGWRSDESKKDGKDDKRQRSKRYGFLNNKRENGYDEKNWRYNETVDLRKEKRFQKGRGQNKSKLTESVMERARRAAKETHERGTKMNYTNFKYPVKLENMAIHGATFKTKNIPIGLVEEVIVTYFLSPNEIYVQLLSTKEDFQKTMNEIQVYYSTKLPVANYPKKGDLVIAKFKGDNVLYRASVIESNPLTVCYVDYGNEEVTERERLWPMDKKFLELEAQAIKCSLPNLIPNGVDTWPVPEALIDKIFEYETYSCKFLNYTGNVFEVELTISENGKNVGDELISIGFALSTEMKTENKTGAGEGLKDCSSMDFNLMRNETYKVLISHVVDPKEFYIQLEQHILSVIAKEVNKCSEAQKSTSSLDNNCISCGGVYLANIGGINWRRVKIIKKGGTTATVQLIDYGAKLDVPYEQIKPIADHLLEYPPQAVQCCLFNEIEDEECSPDIDEELKAYDKYFVIAYVQCVLGNRLKVTLYDMDGEKLDFLTNLNNSPTIIRPLTSVPITKQGIKIVTSHIVSPNEIYIQRLSDIPLLEELNSDMYESYGDGGENLKPGTKICAAKSITDESWYRARLLMTGENHVKVNYIDFGNSEKLPLNNIKQLKREYLEQYAFCRRISLNIDYELDEEIEITNKLCELVMNKECIGYFLKVDDILCAELIVDDEAISDKLLSDRMKRKVDGLFGETEIEEIISENEEEFGRTEEIAEKDFGVFISHVSSPNEFWIHHESISNELENFQNTLQNICSNALPKKNVQIGDIIGAQFTDELWYRGIIRKVEEKVLILQFLDYGNSLKINYSGNEVVHLPEDIVKVRPFAIFCSLRGQWKETASLRFEEIITSNQDPFTLIELEGENPKIIDLVKDGVSITGQLISEGYDATSGDIQDEYDVYITHINSPNDFYIQRNGDKALFDTLISGLLEADMFEDVDEVKENEIYCAKYPENKMWYRAKVLKQNENDVYVHFIDYGNNCNVTDIKLLPVEFMGISSLSLNCALLYGQRNDSWSEAACKKFTEYVSNSAFKMEIVLEGVQRSVVTLFTEDGESLTELLEKLCEPDGREDVCITYNNSPSDFYVQRVNNTDYDVISERLKDMEKLEDLEKKEIGMLCAAEFQDGMWYRAELKKICDDDYEVFFIDYGNTALTKELKSLPDDIKDIEPLAKNCCLDLGLQNIPESIKEEFLHLIGQSHLLRIRVIKPGERDLVSLMLDGMKLEEVLLYTLSGTWNVTNQELENQSDMKTELDDEFQINVLPENLEVDNRIGNETDEEKSVKFASISENTEGFRSDDEKGNIESYTMNSSIERAPDNELNEFPESEMKESMKEEWIEETIPKESKIILNQPAEWEDVKETNDEIKENGNINIISECYNANEINPSNNETVICEPECSTESPKGCDDSITVNKLSSTMEMENRVERKPVRRSIVREKLSFDDKLVSAVVNGTIVSSPN